MVLMNIHWETFDKESFERIEKLAEKGPIAVSIAPWQIERIQDYQIKRLKDILSQEGNILGQQGLNHKCMKCKEFHREKKDGKLVRDGIDPWHENYCLWFGEIPEEEQEKFMKRGKEQLEKLFKKEPELYVPPNHYYDLNTIRVAIELGYKWLTDLAQIPLKPYRVDSSPLRGLQRLIIVPESDPEIKKNGQFYIHADRWEGDLDKVVARGLESFYNIKTEKYSKSLIEENRKMKLIRKIARDLHKGYEMPEENAKKCAELLYATKFGDSSFS